jgi:two-component system OmpR family response regulator
MATILVVDDDPDTCEVVSRYLEKSGHHTVFAENGWEALLRLDSHTVNLILLDVMMPGMDGVTFLKILRGDQHQKSIPVAVMSALSQDVVRSRLARLGVAEILPKGSGYLTDLLDVVERLAGGNAERGQHTN